MGEIMYHSGLYYTIWYFEDCIHSMRKRSLLLHREPRSPLMLMRYMFIV